MRRVLVLLCLMAGSASAQDVCPPVPDHSEAYDALHRELRLARDESAARVLSGRLWALWTDAPDATAQELLDEGMRRRAGYDFLGARDVLDELVEYCPDYAEGYNQRAFASFLRQDYDAALWDLNRALEINPRHIGALSGKALTLLGLGRDAEGQEVLREAVRLNPHLAERALLTEPLGEPI